MPKRRIPLESTTGAHVSFQFGKHLIGSLGTHKAQLTQPFWSPWFVVTLLIQQPAHVVRMLLLATSHVGFGVSIIAAGMESTTCMRIDRGNTIFLRLVARTSIGNRTFVDLGAGRFSFDAHVMTN